MLNSNERAMKQLKLTILLALLLTYAHTATAQYAFRVLASSGTSKVGENKLYVGKTLQANQSIQVGAQSYLSLVHKNGGTVEIGKAGTYQVNNLESELMKRASQTTTGRFANYIVGELTKAGDRDIHKNPYKYQNVTGSVERGQPGDIKVLMPKTSPVLFSQYTIAWHPLDQAGGYIVKVQNDFDEVVMEEETSDTTFSINLKDPKLADAFLMKMTVMAKNDPSKQTIEFAVTLPEESEKAQIQAQYEGFATSENPSPMDKLNEAFFFEENDYLVDALQAFQAATQLAPDSEPIRTALNQFLIRHSMGKYQEIQTRD